MRYALIVAWHEFAENAKTMGFWITISIFPIMIYLSFSVGSLIEKTKSVRHYALVDQSGKLEGPIHKAMERRHQREVLAAFGKWVQKNSKSGPSIKAEDLEKMPAEGIEQTKWAGNNPELLDEFLGKGFDVVMKEVRPKLRDDAGDFTPPRDDFQEVPLPEGIDRNQPAADLAEALKPYLRGERSASADGARVDLFAAVIVPKDIFDRAVKPPMVSLPGSEKLGIQYWSVNLADEDLKDEVERASNDEFRRTEYDDQLKEKASVVKFVQRTYLPFAALDPKKEAGEEAVSIADKIRQWAPVAFVYLLWIAVFQISVMLLNNTIEEKSNRIIEVLLSSVTPGELMMGKLVGIAAVGLTMIGAWILSLVTILTVKAGQEAEIAGEILKVVKSSGLLTSVVVYFALGYLLYAGAFLAIGSLCSTLKEAQNMMQPIMLVMIVPLLTMMFIPKEPNGTLATVLSWIPLYTPFVMMNRAAADPPMFERVGTMVVLVVTTITMLWLSGRIFRIGVLRTGQPPKLMELVRDR